MSSQTPPLSIMSTVAPSQGLCSSPRGNYASTTFREHQMVTRGQSTSLFQGPYNGQSTPAASSTSSHQSRSPPFSPHTVPGQIRRATPPLHHSTSRDGSPVPPLAPIHSMNQKNIVQQARPRSQSDLLQHNSNQMAAGLARPAPRAARPRFMSLESFKVTSELIAEIEQTYPMVPGMSGVAYAGGARSGPVSGSSQLKPSSLPKEPTLDRARNDKDHETWGLHQHTDSPEYLHSLGDPSDHFSSYNLDDRELRSAQATALPPNPPVLRQNVPFMELLRSKSLVAEPATQSPKSQSVKSRIPDKSLPVREETEEDDAHEQNDTQEQEHDQWTPGLGEDGWPARRHGQDIRDPGRQHHAASPPTPSSGPVAAYYHGYPHSPVASFSRPSAPIPPISHQHSAPATSPSPLISEMTRAHDMKPVLPPPSPALRVSSPYPHPYEHVHRRSYDGSYNGTIGLSQMDSNILSEQLALQMQIYGLDNGGRISDSTLSPSLTSFPGPQYNPWAFIRTSKAFDGGRGGMAGSAASMRSSQSHEPVPLPPPSQGHRGPRRRERSRDLRQWPKTRPPPRVESTQPRDTSPELSSDEDTVGESKVCEPQSGPQYSAPRPARWNGNTDDEDKADADDERWIDEDVGIEGVADDLLQFEFHTDYVSDPEKRRRRWKLRWEALLRDFHALDRETNTTLVLLAAPFHTGKLHSVASRAVRRDSSLLKSADMMNIRSAFAEIAPRRRTPRPASLLGQLSRAFSSSRDGSPSRSSHACEEDLRRALDTAIGSLHALGSLYVQQEMRWIEEKHRLDEDQEKAQLLLKQVLSVAVVGNLVDSVP